MKLNRRERMAVAAGVGFICLFVVVRFVAFPFLDQKERVARTLAINTQKLEEIQQLKRAYENLVAEGKEAGNRFKKRKRGFTLYAFMDELAGEVGIKDKVTYMKPTRTKQKESQYTKSLVDMKITGLTLEQITQYLYKIEMSKNMVNVKRLSLTKSDDKEGILNVVLQVETFEV